jgi:hypothetical protein
MIIDYDALTALTALAAALIAILAIWLENQRSRFSLGVDLLMKMSDRFFYSNDFKKSRREAIKFIVRYKKKTNLENVTGVQTDSNYSEQNSVDLEAVLDFFEGLAILVRKKSIDKELACNYFYYWLDCYRELANEYVLQWRKKTPGTWYNIDWLYQELTKVEYKGSKVKYLGPDKELLEIFINDERNLDVE